MYISAPPSSPDSDQNQQILVDFICSGTEIQQAVVFSNNEPVGQHCWSISTLGLDVFSLFSCFTSLSRPENCFGCFCFWGWKPDLLSGTQTAAQPEHGDSTKNQTAPVLLLWTFGWVISWRISQVRSDVFWSPESWMWSSELQWDNNRSRELYDDRVFFGASVERLSWTDVVCFISTSSKSYSQYSEKGHLIEKKIPLIIDQCVLPHCKYSWFVYSRCVLLQMFFWMVLPVSLCGVCSVSLSPVICPLWAVQSKRLGPSLSFGPMPRSPCSFGLIEL